MIEGAWSDDISVLAGVAVVNNAGESFSSGGAAVASAGSAWAAVRVTGQDLLDRNWKLSGGRLCGTGW